MVYYDHLPLDKEILKALGELSIDYVFQPIFLPDGKTVYAYEALMRPQGKTVMELIDEYAAIAVSDVWEESSFPSPCLPRFPRLLISAGADRFRR